MNNRTFPGERLQRRREELGLTTDDVYRKLRIPSAYVQALESGRLEQLPTRTYAVGFLTTYCKYLGFDAEAWIARLDEERAPSTGFRRFTAKHNLSIKRPPWLRETLTWASIIAVLGLGWLTFNVIVQPTAEVSAGQLPRDTTEMLVPELTPPNR